MLTKNNIIIFILFLGMFLIHSDLGAEEFNITAKEVIIDKDAYNALPSGEKKRITKYDMEFKRNEKNREIKIISRSYVEGILKEAQTKRYR